MKLSTDPSMRFPVSLVLTASVILIAFPVEVTFSDEIPIIERRLPPEGIELQDVDYERIHARLIDVEQQYQEAIPVVLQKSLNRFLPDVAIYIKSVRYAIDHGEFYTEKDILLALDQLQTAKNRLDNILNGTHPWSKQRGRVVRGYQSTLDHSPQPYGLVIPEHLDLTQPVPLYVWLHGRAEKRPDLQFIHNRETITGTINPKNAIVLHPFGRYCNAYKFAGEVDVLESIQSVCERYLIDTQRVILWGFSMGGAGVWHLGAHHPDRWVAISPGAGFSETARYQNIQPADFPPHAEQTLWNLFDVPQYTRNLFNLPVVAYSGEKDKQIQAARVMEEAFEMHGRKLTHLIGPGMGHRYHPDTLIELSNRMESYVRQEPDPYPESITFQTRTLRYPRCHWIEVTGLEEHWKDSRVDATLDQSSRFILSTQNISELRIRAPGEGMNSFKPRTSLHIDGQTLLPDSSHLSEPFLNLKKRRKQWQLKGSSDSENTLHKVPGLQGPIDDVWMEPFIVVTPSGSGINRSIDQWVHFELNHLIERWRLLFRGDVRIKRDIEITKEDMNSNHLVLWGDPQSNRLIGKLSELLPIRWENNSLVVQNRNYNTQTHIPVMIYPNLLMKTPSRYVVLNSGMTFREGHDRTNSLQNPKLPDWAIIDITLPPDRLKPGRIVDCNFFDESWQLKTP